MQTSKLSGNRRTVYVLDVICNRFYFEEVQEEVIGQCTGQGISAPTTEGPFLGKNTSRAVKEIPLQKLQWSLQVCLENCVKFESHSKCASMKVCYTPWKPQRRKRRHFKHFEGSQCFFPDLREKDSLLIRFQRKVE